MLLGVCLLELFGDILSRSFQNFLGSALPHNFISSIIENLYAFFFFLIKDEYFCFTKKRFSLIGLLFGECLRHLAKCCNSFFNFVYSLLNHRELAGFTLLLFLVVLIPHSVAQAIIFSVTCETNVSGDISLLVDKPSKNVFKVWDFSASSYFAFDELSQINRGGKSFEGLSPVSIIFICFEQDIV